MVSQMVCSNGLDVIIMNSDCHSEGTELLNMSDAGSEELQLGFEVHSASVMQKPLLLPRNAMAICY